MALDIRLHPKQSEVFRSPKRFKVVVAGRRAGKTYLSYAMIIKWSQDAILTGTSIYYVAPTLQQAVDILWDDIVEWAAPLIASVHINSRVITFHNKVKLHFKGSDRPETLRGKGLRALVIDEYADMKASVWEEILRPTLSHSKGPALFIGTPKGRNHFYHMSEMALLNENEQWGMWHFTTYDNPTIDRSEIDSAKKDMSSMAFRQEYMASFEAGGSGMFDPAWVKQAPAIPEWMPTMVAVDLAGFDVAALNSSSKSKHLDSCAIASASIGGDRWVVHNIRYGRWTTTTTCDNIISACKEAGTLILGIEKGLALQAIYSELVEAMGRANWYPRIIPLTHGNTKKEERIINALQGRLEHGKITFIPGAYLREFTEQLAQFPSRLTHDDLVDAVSLLEQLIVYGVIASTEDYEVDDYQPLNSISGY